MTDSVRKLLDQHNMPGRIARESTAAAGKIIDDLLNKYDSTDGVLSLEYLRQARDEVESCLQGAGQMAQAAVLVPVGVWGLGHGLTAPDLDISLLGIGNHRFFLFHSALGLVALRYFYNKWVESHSDRTGVLRRFGEKVAGFALGTYAMGVGVHLMIDVFQPKAVIFPFIGSLVNGTLVDDNIWLMGNSLWAFKIGHDLMVLTVADELEIAKAWVKQKFEGEGYAIFNRHSTYDQG